MTPANTAPPSHAALHHAASLWVGRMRDADALNQAIVARFNRVRDQPEVEKTHFLAGRFENLIVPRELIPELEPVLELASFYAKEVVADEDLRFAFWFNAMGPGHKTLRHDHLEDRELLSAVYYIDVPENSGRLLLYNGQVELRYQPRAGDLILFDPSVPHEVEPNQSERMRLAVAMNFGPA